MSDGELRPGVRSVAAPIFSYDNDVVAAICVRHYAAFGEPPDQPLVRTVVEIAQRISYSVGFGAVTSFDSRWEGAGNPTFHA